MEPLLTICEVGKMLGLSAKRIHGLVREGRIECVQLTARERRFLPEQIEAFVRGRTIPQPKPIDKTASTRVTSDAKSLPKRGGGETDGNSTKAHSLREEMRQW